VLRVPALLRPHPSGAPAGASSRGVPSPGGDPAGYRHSNLFVGCVSFNSTNEAPWLSYCAAALRRVAKASPVADEVRKGWRMGLFQTSSKREATGMFLWLVSPHLK
jgi:hypothetical protein